MKQILLTIAAFNLSFFILSAASFAREGDPGVSDAGAGEVSTAAQVAGDTTEEGIVRQEIEIGTEPAPLPELKPDDMAISVNGQAATWQETVAKSRLEQGAGTGEEAKKVWLRMVLQQVARRKVLLDEANKRGITLTEEEKQAYLDKLDKDFKASGSNRSVEKFLSQFPAQTASLFDMSLDDALRVAKLAETVNKTVTVSEAEVDEEKQKQEARQAMLRAENEKTRQEISKLLENEDIQTDEGFAGLARKYSQGQEAASGGILGTVPRSAIARLHGLESFDLEKGETSQVLESGNAFRVIRVLEVTPGDPEEKVKIAQILYRRAPVKEGLTRDAVRLSLKRQKEKQAIDVFSRNLIKTADIECPLFPEGLFESDTPR